MRIINQNKNISMNFDSITIARDECVIHTKVDGRTVILGRYESAEQANTVFTDIHEKYANNWSVFVMPQE